MLQLHILHDFSSDAERLLVSLAEKICSTVNRKVGEVMTALDDLSAEVANNTNVVQSTQALIAGLVAQVQSGTTAAIWPRCRLPSTRLRRRIAFWLLPWYLGKRTTSSGCETNTVDIL